MTLSLNPQCCCGGAGVVRTFDTFASLRLAEPEWDTWTNAACWQNPPGGTFESGHPLRTMSIYGGTLGFDRKVYWVIGYIGHDPTPDFAGAIENIDLRTCSNGVSTRTEMIDDATAAAILFDSYPADPGTLNNPFAAWCGHSVDVGEPQTDRLYGYTRFYDGDVNDQTFIGWSTIYDGTDYQEEFTITGGPAIPATMNVQEGVCFTIRRTGFTELEFQAGGSTYATMDGALLNDSVNARSATAEIGGQRLAIVDFLTGPKLVIVANGADYDDQYVEFEVLEGEGSEEEEVVYHPVSIGWDVVARNVVVVWRRALAGVWPTLVTYIANPLAVGNIIGQTGVQVFHCFGIGVGYGADGAPVFWHVVIPGKLPRALEFEEGHVEPPPTEPDCSGLDECVSDTEAYVTPFAFTDYSEGPDSWLLGINGTIGVDSTRFWTLNSALYFEFHLPNETGVYYYSTGNLYTLGDYAEAQASGRRIQYDEFEPSAFDPVTFEHYVYKMDVEFECIDGRVYFKSIELFYEEFMGWDGGNDPPATNGTFSQVFQGSGFLVDHILTGVASGCRSGNPVVRIEFSPADPGSGILIAVNGDEQSFMAMGRIDIQ